MAISRPFLLALLGVALLAATVFAVQNARNSASDEPAPVAQQPAEQAVPSQAPAEPAKAEALTAEQALSAILEPGTPLDSARFTVDFETEEVAGGREHDTVHIEGAFDDADKGAGVSNFDVSYRSRDELTAGKLESAYNLRVLSADGKGYVGQGDQMYATPDQLMQNVGTIREGMAKGAPSKLPEFQLTRWLDGAKVVGVEQVDGVEATHVTGAIAAGSVARDVVRLMTAEAAGAGSVPDVPAGTQGIAKRSVKSARLDAWVGPDRIVRRVSVATRFDAPKALREPGDSARWTANLDVRLTEVNEPQQIAAPDVEAGSPAKGLGKKDAGEATSTLTVLAMGLDAPGGVVGTTYSFLSLNRFSDSNEVARKVLRSVEDGNETVVFFQNPRGLDDKATAKSVSYLKAHTKRLAVFTDNAENAERYGKLTENLGVSQAPAIVFIDRRGNASLIEGYVDGPSLTQVIADAR